MSSYIESGLAADLIRATSPDVIDDINKFTRIQFRTRGGRMGSGMGLLLEGLWGYATSRFLGGNGIEISWLAEDQYNDYAVTFSGEFWDPETRAGELLRIEAKSMNLGAAETKGHFAELRRNIGDDDLLLIMLWCWEPLDDHGFYVAPQITSTFLGKAIEIAELRDAMHLARGGAFVSAENCPDGCDPDLCMHDGEPLNASGKRERISGPESCRPNRVSFANNFGGLRRMIGAREPKAKAILAAYCEESGTAKDYIDFINSSRL